tara:strand:+ start:752 stop:1039 length:288 start_codon:yes stop_codon:yes gene_type:complete
MANLFIYFTCIFAFLALGGASVDLSKDTNDSIVAYLDMSSMDSFDSDPDELDAAPLSSSFIDFIFQQANLNCLYHFSFNFFTVQAFHIRAPPYSS